MTEQTKLKTNHNIRIVNLTTGDNVLCMFGEIRGEDDKVVGYRMLYPYRLTLGEENEDLGTTTKFMKYSIVYMKAIKALQEAQERIEKLEQENIALRARVTNLEGN